MGNGVFKTPKKSVPVEKKQVSPGNATYVDKSNYGTKVSEQVAMTAMSYQDYYARNYDAMEKAGITGEDRVKFAAFHEILATMHKGGKRAIKALQEDGVNWKTSKHLTAADKQYLGYVEKNLDALKEFGISLDASPEEVKQRIKENFGKTGEETIRNAEIMPIHGEIITDKEQLRKGDRVISKDLQEGEMLALRGGNSAATAILYMATFMTCQGVSVEGSRLTLDKFKEVTQTKGEEAFSTSSDERGLKKKGYTNEKIEKLKKSGMFAMGLAMFTKGRFDDISAYYVMQNQLDCSVSLCTNMDYFVEGQADAELQIIGELSITKEESIRDWGGGKQVTVEVFKKGMDGPTGESIYKKIYQTTPITSHDGEFSVTISQEELNKFEAGEYLVSGKHEGDVLEENLVCGSEVTLSVGKAPVKEEPVQKPKIPPLRASVTLFTRRRAEETFTTSEGKEGYRKQRKDRIKFKLGDVERKGFNVACTLYFDEIWETKGPGLKFEHTGSVDGMWTGIGLEMGYQTQIALTKDLKAELETSIGLAGDGKTEFIGTTSGKFVVKDFLAFGANLTKEFEGSLKRLSNRPKQPSVGFTTRVDIGNWTAEIEISDVRSGKPLGQFTIERAFRF
ncbi:MAG: hypothetical protein ABIG39_05530 [Candidatus Micrarchaeota archaeon]